MSEKHPLIYYDWSWEVWRVWPNREMRIDYTSDEPEYYLTFAFYDPEAMPFRYAFKTMKEAYTFAFANCEFPIFFQPDRNDPTVVSVENEVDIIAAMLSTN